MCIRNVKVEYLLLTAIMCACDIGIVKQYKRVIFLSLSFLVLNDRNVCIIDIVQVRPSCHPPKSYLSIDINIYSD